MLSGGGIARNAVFFWGLSTLFRASGSAASLGEAKHDGIWFSNFNEILFSHEKEGGRANGEWTEHCHLRDLGYEGDPFTWRNNNHVAEDCIRERLDRAVTNVQWLSRFPAVKVVNGDPKHSDHRPLFFTKTTLYIKQPYYKTNLQKSSYYKKVLGPEPHGNYGD
jgi:hypothetical protein